MLSSATCRRKPDFYKHKQTGYPMKKSDTRFCLVFSCYNLRWSQSFCCSTASGPTGPAGSNVCVNSSQGRSSSVKGPSRRQGLVGIGQNGFTFVPAALAKRAVRRRLVHRRPPAWWQSGYPAPLLSYGCRCGHTDQHRSANQRQALPCFAKLADGGVRQTPADTLQPAKEQKLGNGQAEDEGHPDHIQ